MYILIHVEPMANEVRILIVLSTPIVLESFDVLASDSYKRDATLSIGISHTESAHSQK